MAGAFYTGTYTGNGSSLSITTPGFQPDLVISFKSGTRINFSDSTTGVGKFNILNTPTAQQTNVDSLTSFDTTGFTVGSSSTYNTNGSVYQYICIKKGGTLFDIQSYTGNQTNRTISHALGAAPVMMLFVNTAGNENPSLYSANLGATSPQSHEDDWVGGTFSTGVSTTIWNNTTPTSSVYSLGTNLIANMTGDAYLGLTFGTSSAQSAFGTYTGNGSASGPSVSGLGFTPALVIITPQLALTQNINLVWGNTASRPLNGASATTTDTTNYINLVSGGFNVVSANADFNSNLQVYTYAAFANQAPAGTILPFPWMQASGGMQDLTGGIRN